MVTRPSEDGLGKRAFARTGDSDQDHNDQLPRKLPAISFRLLQ
jgi:hypothetical protein